LRHHQRITAAKAIHGFIDGGYLWDSFARYDDDTGLSPALAANTHHDLAINFAGTLTLSAISTFYHASNSRSEWLKPESRQKYQRLMAISAFITLCWPYFRDGFSGLKNGNHAYITSASLASSFQHIALHLINPVGIVLGVLLSINLIWYRRMDNQRQLEIDGYKEAILRGEAGAITAPSTFRRGLCYGSAFFDGATDGIYLFGCVIGILLLCHVNIMTGGAPIIAATILLSLWTLASIISKVVSEHEKQLEYRSLTQPDATKKNAGQSTICKVTQHIRIGLCAIKNGRSFVVMIAALCLQKPLNFIGKKIGIVAGGLALGCCYAAMMLYVVLSKNSPKKKSDTTAVTTQEKITSNATEASALILR
jgi:hypothetical protein